MTLRIDSSLYYGLLWLKINWEKNGWDVSDDPISKGYSAIENLLHGKETTEDVDVLIMWTHGRTEIETHFLPPPDIGNSEGWAASIKKSQLHHLLIDHKKHSLN